MRQSRVYLHVLGSEADRLQVISLVTTAFEDADNDPEHPVKVAKCEADDGLISVTLIHG